MKLSVSTKFELSDWGQVKATATVYENPDWGFGDPFEPKHYINNLSVRDAKNKVIQGWSPLEPAGRQVFICSLEKWEIDNVEEKLIEAFVEEKQMVEDSEADRVIDSIKTYQSITIYR